MGGESDHQAQCSNGWHVHWRLNSSRTRSRSCRLISTSDQTGEHGRGRGRGHGWDGRSRGWWAQVRDGVVLSSKHSGHLVGVVGVMTCVRLRLVGWMLGGLRPRRRRSGASRPCCGLGGKCASSWPSTADQLDKRKPGITVGGRLVVGSGLGRVCLIGVWWLVRVCWLSLARGRSSVPAAAAQGPVHHPPRAPARLRTHITHPHHKMVTKSFFKLTLSHAHHACCCLSCR